jgi:hypothetical protein
MVIDKIVINCLTLLPAFDLCRVSNHRLSLATIPHLPVPLILIGHDILLHPADGPVHEHAQDAKRRSHELPDQHTKPDDSQDAKELDKLIDLVQIFLFLNVVLGTPVIVPSIRRLLHQPQLCRQIHRRTIPWHAPYPKDLMHRNVEEEVRLVVSHAFDLHVNPWTHDLVPAVDAADQPARVLGGAGAAERVQERGGGDEEGFYSLALGGGRGLGEEPDDFGDFRDCRGISVLIPLNS